MSTIGSSLASNWASNLFSQLDTKKQGYLEKSDLQSAFSKISGNSSSSTSSSSSVDDVFTKLDSNSDGKVTKDELTSSLENLFTQLNSQLDSSRVQGSGHHGGGQGGPGGANGAPPPPPPGGSDAGFTKSELTSQLKETGSSDSKSSALINKIVNNFDKADTDSDGKVSLKEALAYEQTTQSTSSTASSTSTSSTSSSENKDLNVLLKIAQLIQAYQPFGSENQSDSSSLSISA